MVAIQTPDYEADWILVICFKTTSGASGGGNGIWWQFVPPTLRGKFCCVTAYFLAAAKEGKCTYNLSLTHSAVNLQLAEFQFLHRQSLNARKAIE